MKYDQQRYKKVYPLFKRPSQNLYVIERVVNIENANVSFNGSDTITYTFTSQFRGVPIVNVTPVGTDADILVHIESITNRSVTIKASIENNNSVNINAIETL